MIGKETHLYWTTCGMPWPFALPQKAAGLDSETNLAGCHSRLTRLTIAALRLDCCPSAVMGRSRSNRFGT